MLSEFGNLIKFIFLITGAGYLKLLLHLYIWNDQVEIKIERENVWRFNFLVLPKPSPVRCIF